MPFSQPADKKRSKTKNQLSANPPPSLASLPHPHLESRKLFNLPQQRLPLFQRRKMSSRREHLERTQSRETNLAPFPRKLVDFLGEHRDAYGNFLWRRRSEELDPVAFVDGFVVQPGGRCDGVGDVVDHDVGEELVFCDGGREVFFAAEVGPAVKKRTKKKGWGGA